MIISALVYLGSGIVNAINFSFGLIQFEFPSGFTNAIGYFANTVRYLDFLFPVDTFFSALGVYLSFLFAWYTIKLILWAYKLFPIFGKHIDLPHMKEVTTVSDTSSLSDGRFRRTSRSITRNI